MRPGDLFAALPGARAHGADFAAERPRRRRRRRAHRPGRRRAARRSAGVPVLVHDRPREVLGAGGRAGLRRPDRATSRVLGVTGTSGKTTVAHLLEAGLRRGRPHHRAARHRRHPHRRRGRLPSAFTTPEAPDLQALFAVMAEAGVTDVAMEVSSHALALGRVAGTRFAVGAFTNLSQDHLDFHRDMEDYFAAKAALFDGRAERAVICVDDEWGQRLAARTPDAVTVVHHRAPPTGGPPTSAPTPDGTPALHRARPRTAPRLPVRLQLPGAFNVANALVALACLDAVGRARRGGRRARSPRSRCPAGCSGSTRASRSSPWSTTRTSRPPSPRCWTRCAPQVPGRLIVVLGCGGDRDRGKRPLMGAAAAARGRRCWSSPTTTRAPRTRPRSGPRCWPARAAEPRPRRGAWRSATGGRRSPPRWPRARPGDAVVVAGKGHETGQEIGGRRASRSTTPPSCGALTRQRSAAVERGARR